MAFSPDRQERLRRIIEEDLDYKEQQVWEQADQPTPQQLDDYQDLLEKGPIPPQEES
jgi:hypothetical protein